MANSIEEALQEALNELLSKEWVKIAEVDTSISEDKPGNYVRKRFNVLHKTSQGGYTYSSKEIYVNKSNFTYVWHYGGGELESISTPFRDLLDTGIAWLKSTLGVAYVEIISCNEVEKVATAIAYKTTTGYFADSYTLKVWESTPGNLDFKVITHTTVS